MDKKLERSKALSDFKETLKDKTLEELKAIEADIIKEADEADKVATTAEFNLPSKNYKDVADAIRYFFNKQTVQWQFTLGMITMHDFWDLDKKPKTIKYPMLDSVLRSLGELQFTGYDEWKKVVLINEYFEPIREAYVSVTEKVYDVADRHSAVLSQMKLVDPTATEGVPETEDLIQQG